VGLPAASMARQPLSVGHVPGPAAGYVASSGDETFQGRTTGVHGGLNLPGMHVRPSNPMAISHVLNPAAQLTAGDTHNTPRSRIGSAHVSSQVLPSNPMAISAVLNDNFPVPDTSPRIGVPLNTALPTSLARLEAANASFTYGDLVNLNKSGSLHAVVDYQLTVDAFVGMNLEEAEIANFENGHGGPLAVACLALWGHKLIEYGFSPIHLRQIAALKGGGKTIAVIKENWAALQDANFTVDQVMEMAKRRGGAAKIELVLKYQSVMLRANWSPQIQAETAGSTSMSAGIFENLLKKLEVHLTGK
jgi:hypothetical protein